MKNKVKVEKEKKIDILGLWREFWNSDEKEKSEEEVIFADETLSEEQKKDLLKALKDTDRMASKMFRSSYKTNKIKANNKNVPKVKINQKQQESENQKSEKDDELQL